MRKFLNFYDAPKLRDMPDRAKLHCKPPPMAHVRPASHQQLVGFDRAGALSVCPESGPPVLYLSLSLGKDVPAPIWASEIECIPLPKKGR